MAKQTVKEIMSELRRVPVLEAEIRELRQQLHEAKAAATVATTRSLIDIATTEFPDILAEVHVVVHQQHIWTPQGESYRGLNRFTAEGPKVKRTYLGSTLDNIRGQIFGTEKPDITDHLLIAENME
jgi:hypothetical protein